MSLVPTYVERRFRVRQSGPSTWAVYDAERPGCQLLGFDLAQAYAIAEAANRITNQPKEE